MQATDDNESTNTISIVISKLVLYLFVWIRVEWNVCTSIKVSSA